MCQVMRQINKTIIDTFKSIVNQYQKIYNFDLSYMKLQISRLPCFNNGEPAFDMNPDEFGGCWTKLGFVRINPDVKSVMNYYGVEMSVNEFLRTIIGHELAHEVYNNIASEKFIDDVLKNAESQNFSTVYLDHVSLKKMREETFCEYLSNSLNKIEEQQMKITFDKFKRMLLESSLSIYDEYEDILCEVFEVDDISEITEEQYKQIISDYENDLLNDHDSSLLEDAEDMVIRIANKCSYNVIVHHGTNAKFSEFKYGDIGFHLGTIDQAKSRLIYHEDKPVGTILNTAISIHNPLVIEDDLGDWRPEEIITGAIEYFWFDTEIKKKLVEKFPNIEFDIFDGKSDEMLNDKEVIDFIEKEIKSMQIKRDPGSDNRLAQFCFLYHDLKFEIKDLLRMWMLTTDNERKFVICNRIKSLGYDGIKYLNLYENEDEETHEHSYIVFNANQIKNCEVISFKDGKIVPLEERFNSSTNNLFESKKDKAYLMALEIFNTLTNEEKWLVSPRHGMLKNVPVLYRYVIPNKAFIDIYPYNNNSKIGFILLAVNPEYRRMGMTQKLIQKTIENCKRLGIKKLIWRCDSNNIGSYKAAIANGFKLKTKGKTYYSFEMVIE